ncbi:hypothetical protein LTR36_005742 [Oleoguttula mirabilis]|uniref:AB hydrolase-1 domain-containing protein n=1 Tax=Oleoguttula mirabilis TaxID=1507867 RepID=A0AAV9JDK5_9PEZI|nr:hypothetical protein LTR36_005742 [Oleoguttula mirabilis]
MHSGVEWKFAKQGFALLSLSTQEADSLSHNPDFSRKLYIDSLEYLLNGLPTELTAQEELSLRAAVPAALAASPTRPLEGQLAVHSVAEDDRHEPSILRRAVGCITLYTFVIISTMLPYIQLFLQRAYQYDRKHQISDSLIAHTVQAANTAGRQTLVLANHLCGMNDGHFGDAAKQISIWCIQGVSGGVYDGLGGVNQTSDLNMDQNPAEAQVELQGVNYYTLLEEPSNGAADAPCILLCHALMSNLHMWDATAKALNEAGYRTLRYDHVGHHNTPPAHDADASYHMDDLTRHAHQLVKMRTGQSHLKAVIGCSIGGVVALRYAMLFPQDVDNIISIAAPGIKSPEAAASLWTERIQLFKEDQRTGNDVLCHKTIDRWFPGGRAEDDNVRSEALMHVKTCSLQGYKTLADTIRDYDYTSEVSDIQNVCLVIAGSDDTAGDPGRLRDVAGVVKNAEFVVMDRTGHLPPMHRPDEFNDRMLRFL